MSTAVIVAYGELIVTTALNGKESDGADYVAAGIVYGFGALGFRSVLR